MYMVCSVYVSTRNIPTYRVERKKKRDRELVWCSLVSLQRAASCCLGEVAESVPGHCTEVYFNN